MKQLQTVNLILLGLLMLVAGSLKLFVVGVDNVVGMMSGIILFSWAPVFWAWVLIVAEIGSGIAILAKWKLRYATIVPVVILTIATLFVTIKWASLDNTNWNTAILHAIAITNYLLLGFMNCKK